MMANLFNVSIKHTDNTKITSKVNVLGPRYNDLILLRRNIKEFLEEILPTIHNCDVLEIGPRTKGQNDSLPKKLQDTYIYTDKILLNQDNTYKTCDLNPRIRADYQFDVNELPEKVGQAFDVIICCDVMEHTPEFWKLPETFYKLLRDKGKLFLTVPFYFMHHDPKPDYWRFTEDGLEYLFAPYFNIRITKLLWQHDDGQRAIHLTLEGVKHV